MTPFGRRFTEELFDHFLDRRDTGRTAYQDHFVDLTVAQSGVGHRFLHGSIVARINLSASCSNLARVRVITRCCGIPSTGMMYGRLISVEVELDSSIFAFSAASFQTLQGHRIFAQVDVMLFFELVGHPVDNHVVEVVASEVRVAVGRFHFGITPSPSSRIEISNVPPPRSYTAIFISLFALSRP